MTSLSATMLFVLMARAASINPVMIGSPVTTVVLSGAMVKGWSLMESS